MEELNKGFLEKKWVNLIIKLFPHLLTASVAIVAIVSTQRSADRQLDLGERQFKYFEKKDEISKGYYWFRLKQTMFDLRELAIQPVEGEIVKVGYYDLDSLSEEKQDELVNKALELLISEIDNPLISENPEYFESWRQAILITSSIHRINSVLDKPFSETFETILDHALNVYNIPIPYPENENLKAVKRNR